jgi:hypothetical protein
MVRIRVARERMRRMYASHRQRMNGRRSRRPLWAARRASDLCVNDLDLGRPGNLAAKRIAQGY